MKVQYMKVIDGPISSQLEEKKCCLVNRDSLFKINAWWLENCLVIFVCSTASFHTLSDKELHQVFNFVCVKWN